MLRAQNKSTNQQPANAVAQEGMSPQRSIHKPRNMYSPSGYQSEQQSHSNAFDAHAPGVRPGQNQRIKKNWNHKGSFADGSNSFKNG